MKQWKEVVFQASLDLSRANTHLLPGAEFPRVSTPDSLNCAASGDNVVSGEPVRPALGCSCETVQHPASAPSLTTWGGVARADLIQIPPP